MKALLSRLALASLLFVAGCPSAPEPQEPLAAEGGSADAVLTFILDGEVVRTLSLNALLERIEPEQWSAYDPYYNRQKTWKTLPLEAILKQGFEGRDVAFSEVEYALRATDGYEVPMGGAQAMEPGAFVAFADVEVSQWEPIGDHAAHPGPFYLVWREAHQHDLVHYPRPWQLAQIEVSPFAKRYPHTIPAGVRPGDPAMRGFGIFRKQCLKCHAMNREGGRVGPELNVPQSIVEYRETEQLKAYIREPARFRYTAMPAHPGLSDQDLDDLVAYFQAMRLQKHDPATKPPTEAP